MRLVRGYSLVELMVVFTVVAGLAATVLPIWFNYQHIESAKRINRDAMILLEALNQYYARHCSNPALPVVTVAQLGAEGILVGDLAFNNPWGGGYALTIDRSQPTNPRLRVSLSFTDAADATLVATFARNVVVTGSTVTWTKQSSLGSTSQGVNRQLDREMFGTPRC